ncbi:MAG: metal-sensitive transcriptional regulator [Candidatus Melainabacteria bacterium]|nr:metal-sensitive transcriptional regulator [Candidatus Melainabacteria bacterium]
MPITDTAKEKHKNRLSRALGHLNAIYRMVDEQRYCVDVIHQIKAVQAALDRVSEEILREHLETCVVEAIHNQDETRMIEELMQVFRKAPQLYSLEGASQPQEASAAESSPASSAHKTSPVHKPTKGCCS